MNWKKREHKSGQIENQKSKMQWAEWPKLLSKKVMKLKKYLRLNYWKMHKKQIKLLKKKRKKKKDDVRNRELEVKKVLDL